MSKKKYLTCSRKYDLPLYCAAWPGSVTSKPRMEADAGLSSKQPDDEAAVRAGGGLVVFGGGGGDRKTGLMNSLVLAHYDPATDVLSEAISTISTDDYALYRLALHRGSNEIVCSLSKDCRLVELRSDEGLKLEWSEKVLQPLQDVGEQNCLVFSTDGTRLAAGGEDGHLRVFEWPSLDLVLDQPSAHQSVKDLDFSLDSSLLASTGDSGPCRIWDLSKACAVASLSSDKGSNFGFCRFSRDGTNPVLFVTLREAGKGLIGLWDTKTWTKIRAKKFTNGPISTFSASSDGKLLAIGSESDVRIVDTKKLGATQLVRRAHMIFVTSMEFSSNGRFLLSVSADSSARVTAIIQPSKREGWRVFVSVILLFIFGLLFAYMRADGESSVRAVVHDVLARILPSNSTEDDLNN